MAFDVAVIGLGAMGSAALGHLARRGLRALGIERFAPGHDRGSSHGRTRIIRLGYFEHPSYVPLVRRAYALWRDIEAKTGRTLLHVTGIVEIGRTDGVLVPGTLASSRQHGLAHEVLDAAEVMRRFPAFALAADLVGVWQPQGGFLEAEAAVATLLDLATSAGAELRTNARVVAVEPHGGGVRITTDRGTVEAGAAVVTAGPWLPTLLPDLPVALRVTRQILAWFRPREEALFSGGRFPVFLLETAHGIHYGFPFAPGEGLKIAKHHHADEAVDPETCDRAVSAADEAMIRAPLSSHIPAADGELLSARTCLYTMTPDGDFIVDRLPGHPQVLIVSPCSGHGFKFAPAIGEIVADLMSRGTTAHDISRFRLKRFA
jgi:sarcosine oxidase